MKQRKLSTLLLATVSLITGTQAAVTVNSGTVGYIASGTPTATGLRGSFWDRAVKEIPTDGTALALGGWADTTAYGTAPTGSFTATFNGVNGVNYLGNDLTVVDSNSANWLGVDAPSYIGTAGDLDDGLLRFQGYIQITLPGTVITGLGTNTDDGSRVYIGTTSIINNDGGHGDTTVVDDVTFTNAGYYPVDIRFFNGDWTDAGGNHGGANFRFVSGSAVSFVQNVIPEPSLGALAALTGILALGSRRRR